MEIMQPWEELFQHRWVGKQLEWSLERMRPRKISGNNRALERETMSVDNFFMKFCSKGKH